MINIVITDSGPWWRKGKRFHRLSHPNHWNEVTQQQMAAIGKIMTGEIKEEKMMSIFLSCSKRLMRKLDDYYRYKLSDLMIFMGEKEPMDHFIIDELKGRRAPGNKLRDLSFSEFMYIDTFFIDYSASENDESILQKLVALIFRKPVKGARPVFDGKIDEKWVKNLKPWQMQISAFNYGLIRVWLEKAFPSVFAKQSDMNSGQSKQQGNGWIDVFDSIVGDDLVHSDDYAQMPVMEVLRFLNKRIVESRKQRAKSKSKRK